MSDSLRPTDCSMPGFPVLHCFPVCSDSYPSSQWCYLTISSSVALFSFCLQSFPASQSFPMSWLFASGGRSIGASALASVLPVNIQDWLSLGWTNLISLQSKALLRVFSNTTVQKHRFFLVLSLLYGSTLTSVHDYWKTKALSIWNLVSKVNVFAF